MNIKNKILLVLLCLTIFNLAQAQEEVENYKQVFLSQQKTFQLTSGKPYIGNYQLVIDKTEIPKDQEKWYLFAMAQPKQQSTKLFGSPSKIQIRKGDSLLKKCNIIEQSDACFVTNNQFNYSKDKLTFTVQCDEQCQFHFITQIDYAYPLKMNTPFKLNFENTAYTKIFTLNTTGKDFYQLRIMLQPRGFISYGQPVILLANYGTQIPTQLDHDFKGMHTWDDGQGIFIRNSQLQQSFLTILVQGPQKNILDLVAQGWQKQEKLRVEQYLPEFDWIKGGETRLTVLTINQKSLTHIVKILVFSGGIQMPQIFRMDQGIEGKTYPLKFSIPSQKYGQFEFRLSKELIQKQSLKKIVLKLTAIRDTTYLINYAREQSSISVILPYVSQSSYMEPGQIDQYYIKVQQLIQTTKQKKTSKIQVIVGNIQGNVQATFFKCNSVYKAGIDNMKNCQVTPTNKKDFLQMAPSRYENRGGQKRYWFEISWEDHIKRSDRDKSQVVYQIVVLVQNKLQEKTSSYQIQYKNKDRIYLLKEGQLIKDRVFINEKRHYKLSIQDNDATQVRIHCTRISGQAFFIGSFVDPRVDKNRQKILPLYSILTFKINPQQKVSEVFLQVQGVDNSYYSLTTQIIRRSQANPKKNGTTGYNELIVRQGIPYQFLIAPLESIVLQVHASQKIINLNMKSTSAVKVCMTQNLQSPPFAPNCQIKNDFFLQMNQQMELQKGLIGNIGVKNTDTKKNVSIKIMISRPKEKQNSESLTCQLVSMNEIFFKRTDKEGKDWDGDYGHCLEYNLNKNEQVEVIVDLKGEHLYDQGIISVSINDQQNFRILSPSHIFTKQEVQIACAAKNQGDTENFCYLKVSFKGLTSTGVRVLVQYTNQAIRLVDGIAHPIHSLMVKNKPKHFYIGIHNFENITVFLQNKVGEYKIYASLMPYSDFIKNKTNQIYPTQQSKDIQSSNPFYYLEQILLIPASNIQTKCPQAQRIGRIPFLFRKWINCVLLISVYYNGSGEFENNGKFVIEATQQNRELKEGLPLNGYLQKKSTAFYHFQNQKQNATIFVAVNNQNRNCLDIYLRQGSERATAQNNQKHAKANNILILNSAKLGTYSLTFQANENCPFTVTITTSKNNIAKIKKGAFADINLAIDAQKYYIFQNLLNQTFKVLSVHKSGEVVISVNPVPRNNLPIILQSNLSEIKDWAWSGKDSVKISNVDRKNSQSAKYCVDCYYLINIKAIRATEASIVIPTPGSQLPITTDSIIQDILYKEELTTYRIFIQSSAQFEVYLQYGRIKIQIIQSSKNISSYNKNFQPSKAPVLQKFTLPKNQQYDYLRYAKIVVTAERDSYFSFSIVSSPDPKKRAPGIRYGLPQYIFLQSNKDKCVTGEMTAKIDQFLLSFPKNNREIIQKMQMKIKVDDKQVSFDKQFGNNEMLVRINSLGAQSSQNKKFQICLKSSTSVSITFIQSSPLSYWPEKQSILIKKQANLTFSSEGKGVIQLNQCQSRASAQLFSQFNDMKNTGSQIKQRRRTNNIVQFYHNGPVYIKVKSQKATVKWISINQTSGQGLGYEKYKGGTLRFYKQKNNIQVIVQSIRPVDEKPQAGTLSSVKYEFYAASEQMQLYNAMNCGDGVFAKKIIQQLSKPTITTSFDIEKQLKPKFGAEKYFLIGAKAVVTLKIGSNIQQYRFFYPYQQVTKQIIFSQENDISQPQKQQAQSSGEFLSLLGYILIAIVMAAAVYLIYSKCLKKNFDKKKLDQDSLGRQMKYFDLTGQN